MKAVLEQLDAKREAARMGGGEARIKAQHEKGKLSARERLDVLLDDRDTRPGVKFADLELMGVPHRLVIGDRGLDNGELEYKGRRDSEATMIPADKIVDFLREQAGLVSAE